MIEVIVGAIRLEAQDIHSFELFRADGAALPSFEPGAHIDLHLPTAWSASTPSAAPPNGRATTVSPYSAAATRAAARPRCTPNCGSASGCTSASRAISSRCRRSPVRACCSPAASASRRCWRWPNAWPAMAPTSSCTTARIPPSARPRRLPWPVRLRRPRALPLRPRRKQPARGPSRPAGDQSARRPAIPLRAGGLHAVDRRKRPRTGLGSKPLASRALRRRATRRQYGRHLRSAVGEQRGADPGRRRADRAGGLREAGVDLPASCEQGICGTCLTRVLDGEPEHRDLYLSEEEQAANDCFTPCCSRSRSPRLVLDL